MIVTNTGHFMQDNGLLSIKIDQKKRAKTHRTQINKINEQQTHDIPKRETHEKQNRSFQYIVASFTLPLG